MQKNRWSKKFDWIKSGVTYYQQTRSEQYNENRFIAVGDIYFKLNKYLTGVTFTYINSLNDIYKRDLLTGDGYAIYCMYNEYDVIDRVLKNIVFVDASSNINIDLNKQWFSIDSVKLQPGHLVLLFNQNSEFENDIYQVTPQYFLINAGLLSTREKANKFSCSVKMGTNADKQFFLLNNGLDFPVTFEPKYFIEGQSFILKSLIKYNLYNTSTNSAITSKIVFTDYDFARKQLLDNYNLYTPYGIAVVNTSVPTSSYLTINYHHEAYTIRTGTTSGVTFSGITNGVTGITHCITNQYSGLTFIDIPPDFDCRIGDYIQLTIYSGSTRLLMNTYIKDVQGHWIILEEIIPNRILTELKNCYFSVNNLNSAIDWTDAIYKFSNETPYVDFYSVSATTDSPSSGLTYIFVSPEECKYNKYFDYDGITFEFVDDSAERFFYTANQFINYKLADRLNLMNPSSSGFTTGFTFFNTYSLSSFTYQYTDNNRIKLSTTVSGITRIFKPYTYVEASAIGETTEKTLVYEVRDFEIVIEKPAQWSVYPPPIITSIQNVDGLGNISDILYEVYMNDSYDWYTAKSDNERKYIARTYADLLTQNDFFRKNATGILFENEKNEFILKLYDIETDKNLYFSTIELVFVGADRKTRLPVPLKMIESSKKQTDGPTYELDWNVLDGGLDAVLVDKEVFDFGFNVVLGGPNDPPLLYTLIDGNL
jgi:hypothetical protein